MTDFVLEQEAINRQDNFYEETDKYFNKCVNYANFLKQHLNLGMFVTCVDNEVLKEPLNYNKWIKKELNTPYVLDLSKYEQYQQAKERLLFEDVYSIEYIQNIILDRCNTIQDLLSLKIASFELTKSAQKQLGL